MDTNTKEGIENNIDRKAVKERKQNAEAEKTI